ncbi:MAG: MutS-related protein [Solirubrobacteraceae bacterium]
MASVGHGTMTSFASILFEDGFVVDASAEPEFFTDLNLDQIVAAVTAGRDEYELAPFFYAPLREVEAVRYRHRVLADLEQEDVHGAVREFARVMSVMREQVELIGGLRHELQKQRWFLQAVASYCAGVSAFAHRLAELELQSQGMTALRDYMQSYATSEAFSSLASETGEREADLAAVTYGVHIRGTRVRISRYDGEADMSDEVQRAFAKFAQGAVKDHRRTYREDPHMDHIEEQIAELVARLHPETFTALRDYCDRHRGYLDATVVRFDREVQFYLAYLQAIVPLRSLGLTFSHPRVATRSKHEHATQTFDLALAMKLARAGATVVCNDFELAGPERILVVSGPNNGGKTTFARTYGQLHHLAALGLPVPGRDTRLFLPDRIFTHFEREEDIATLRGKFEDELVRIHEILSQATGDSVVIMNESFGSTTLHDALVVGSEIVEQLIDLDVLAVFVTFVDELASLGPSTVSMMSTVVPEDPAVRTYRVLRKPADGLAYASALAEKYGLSYESLRRRIAR